MGNLQVPMASLKLISVFVSGVKIASRCLAFEICFTVKNLSNSAALQSIALFSKATKTSNSLS